jgi:hypothetical protein
LHSRWPIVNPGEGLGCDPLPVLSWKEVSGEAVLLTQLRQVMLFGLVLSEPWSLKLHREEVLWQLKGFDGIYRVILKVA